MAARKYERNFCQKIVVVSVRGNIKVWVNKIFCDFNFSCLFSQRLLQFHRVFLALFVPSQENSNRIIVETKSNFSLESKFLSFMFEKFSNFRWLHCNRLSTFQHSLWFILTFYCRIFHSFCDITLLFSKCNFLTLACIFNYFILQAKFIGAHYKRNYCSCDTRLWTFCGPINGTLILERTENDQRFIVIAGVDRLTIYIQVHSQ